MKNKLLVLATSACLLTALVPVSVVFGVSKSPERQPEAKQLAQASIPVAVSEILPKLKGKTQVPIFLPSSIRYAQELERAMGSSTQSVTAQLEPFTGDAIGVATLIKVIQPTGVLDVTNCSKLRQEIVESANAGVSNVLLDCQNLTFMDSSGLAALVLAAQKVREVNSQLSICSIDRQIKMLFELSSMDDIFEIFPSSREFYSNYSNPI